MTKMKIISLNNLKEYVSIWEKAMARKVIAPNEVTNSTPKNPFADTHFQYSSKKRSNASVNGRLLAESEDDTENHCIPREES